MTGKPEKAAVPRQGQAHIQADLPSVLANASWTEARDLLLRHASPTETESVPLAACAGRVLAFDLRAGSDVPPFDRSAYDGYALRSADVAQASPEHPGRKGCRPSRHIGARGASDDRGGDSGRRGLRHHV